MLNIRKVTGAGIKIARKKKGLTAKEVSMYSGIAQANLSRIENGKVNSTLDTIERIHEAIKIL